MTSDVFSSSESLDIVIVGAGAAGLAAGIFAGEEAAAAGTPCRIVLMDGAKKIGAKILVSGGGRCNVTHDRITLEDFHGPRHLARNILAAFTEQDARAWFHSLGVELKREDTGKLFPVTDRAMTVLEALMRRCGELRVSIRTNHRVTDIEPAGEAGFVVQYTRGATRGALRTRYLIMATGGQSLPRSGSDGHGWTILRRLGHTVTATSPGLVPLLLDESFFHRGLMGVSQQVELSTKAEGRVVDIRGGSLLWTHFGVSGPVVMDASRFWTLTHDRGVPVEIRCSFLPGVTGEEAERRFLELSAAHPRLSILKLLTHQHPERFVEALCRHCRIDPATQAAQLRRDARRTLLEALTALVLPVTGQRGWNFAEVTTGGVPLDEINFRTMASKMLPGLYVIGELLDCDGRIGGFNFQWGWTTGHLAGRAAVAALHGARSSALSCEPGVRQASGGEDEGPVHRPAARGRTDRAG
jgi:predicted Rossmann fold flavoprotein